MLTSSEVAAKYKISNRQVNDLVNYGFLTVAQVLRHEKRGISFLFAESDLERMDIPSLLAEIRDKKKNSFQTRSGKPGEFRQLQKAFKYYDRFMEDVDNYSEAELLKTSFYLFHLNHYAKTYHELSKDIYEIKKQVLKKMYQENQGAIKASYLLGPDRKKVWLCEDCKEASRSAGISYNSYIQNEAYCPKCDIQVVEREYYSLVEFSLKAGEYRFVFHTPRSLAAGWMKNIRELPQEARKTGHYQDRMYLYGRSISNIEEKAFPLPMLKERLIAYLNNSTGEE
ncbi:MAG: hypothetical protein PHC92_04600 [Syntrophomonadaceae bacterium]|nr:hypothetical protein [Syntrophomonadaceae bacterium]MDD3023076.1 hypothetical protein [Syntrophomonadaceae bacterium]